MRYPKYTFNTDFIGLHSKFLLLEIFFIKNKYHDNSANAFQIAMISKAMQGTNHIYLLN